MVSKRSLLNERLIESNSLLPLWCWQFGPIRLIRIFNGIIRRLWAGQPNCMQAKILRVGAGPRITHSLWISDTESSTAIKPMADPFHYSIGRRPNFNKATDEVRSKPNLTKEKRITRLRTQM